MAASSCRYVYWQRSSLEYLFVKEPYLASVVTTLIARDITTKLYAMNNKIVTERGSHLDIRLPSISHALVRSPRRLRSACKPPPPTTVQPVPPEKRPSKYCLKCARLHSYIWLPNMSHGLAHSPRRFRSACKLLPLTRVQTVLP